MLCEEVGAIDAFCLLTEKEIDSQTRKQGRKKSYMNVILFEEHAESRSPPPFSSSWELRPEMRGGRETDTSLLLGKFLRTTD